MPLAGSKPTQPRSVDQRLGPGVAGVLGCGRLRLALAGRPCDCDWLSAGLEQVAADVAGGMAEMPRGGDEDMGEILADAMAVGEGLDRRWCRCRWR